MKYWLLTLGLCLTGAVPALAQPGVIVFDSTRSGNNHIYKMNPDGSGLTQLTSTAGVDEMVPGVSPDGSKIAYERQNDVWYMNADGSGQTDISIGGGPQSPNFEPGTNLISFSNPSYPDYAIFTIPITGGSPQKIIGTEFGSYWGHWSPDGSKIALTTFDEEDGGYPPDIYVANANGSGETRLTHGDSDENPSWSPDGGQIVWQSARAGGGYQIYIMNANGSNQTRITNDTSNDTEPTFSPDGQKIAFVSDRDGYSEIYTMNVDGSDQTKITQDPYYNEAPYWAQSPLSNPPVASIGNVTTTEGTSGTSNAVFTVTLSAASTSTVTVGCKTYDGTAVAGTNYSATNGDVVFPPGATTETFSVPIIGGTPAGLPTSFTVRIAPVGATVGNQAGTGTILNPSYVPTANISGGSALVSPAGSTPFNFGVTLSGASGTATTINYTTVDGTAVAGTDYTATSGTLTLSPGTTSATITVPVLATPADASGLTFSVALSSPVNATLGTSSATCTITHDAVTAATVSPNSLSSVVAQSELLSATYTSLEGGASLNSAQICVGQQTGPSTSLYANYNPATNLLYLEDTNGVNQGGFAPGSANTITTTFGSLNCASTTVTVSGNQMVVGWSITPSAAFLGAQTVFLNASDTYGVSSGWTQAGTWTISYPVVTVDDNSVVVGPSGTVNAVLTVVMSPAPAVAASVQYATADETAVAGTNYTATSGTLNFPAGTSSETVTVPILGTPSGPSPLYFNLVTSNPVNATISTAWVGECAIFRDTVSVSDDFSGNMSSEAGQGEYIFGIYKSAASTFNIPSAQICVGPTGSPGASLCATYDAATNLLYLQNASGTNIGGFAPGSANTITTPMGSLICANTHVYNYGSQIEVTWYLAPSAVLAGAQPTFMNVTDGLGVTSGWVQVTTWTITLPTASIANTSVVVAPSTAQNAVFTVTVSPSPALPVTLNYATADGTAVAGTDYTTTTGTLTIPAGSTSGTISVPVLAQPADASGLNFSLALSSPANANIGAGTATCTIVHDVVSSINLIPSTLSCQVNQSELLTANYSSSLAAGQITSAQICVGATASLPNALCATYNPATNLLYLENSSGTNIGGFAPGSTNVITTTYGSLNCASTTVSKSGNVLTIGWNLSPAAGLIGSQPVSLDATDNDSVTSGWQQLGTWAIALPMATIANTSVVVGPSGTSVATFTVTLSPVPAAPATLNYATTNGTAAAGTDYTATSGTLNFAAGTGTATFNVTCQGGTTDASGLTFQGILSNPVNAGITTGTGTCTILHDVAPVCVSVTPSPLTSAVGGPEVLTTTFTSIAGATRFASAALCIGKLSSPSASLYAKYVASTNLLYLDNASGTYIGGFAPGSNNVITTSLATLNCAGTTVTASGNTLIVGWDITPIALTGTQNDYLIAGDTFGLSSGWQNLGTWTLTNPSVSVANTAVTVGPSGSQSAVFTVTMTPPPVTAASVNYATANGTAHAGTDYTATSGTLNFPVGTATETVSVPVLGTTTDASGLTFSLGLSSPVNVTVSGSLGVCTIAHDVVSATSLTPASLTSVVGQPEFLTGVYGSAIGAANITSAQINVGPSGSGGAPSTTLVATYDAATKLLYLENSSGVQIGGFAPGSNNVISTSLGSLNCANTAVNANGTQLSVVWSLAPGVALAGTQSTAIAATDNLGATSGWQQPGTWTLTAPTVSIGNTSAIVGTTGSSNAVFPVTISPASPVITSINYATADGTAIAGTDYTATSGTLTIPAGATNASINVPVLGTTADASGLAFTVTLSSPALLTLGTATGTCTITHDAVANVSLNPTSLTSLMTQPEQFTGVYSSLAGGGEITSAQIGVGSLASPATTLFAIYDAATNLLYLENSSGVQVGGFAPGSNDVISTPLGSLNCAATTAVVNGSQLTVNWNLTPSASLIGTQTTNLNLTDQVGLTTGWQPFGTWTINPIPLSVANTSVVVGPSGTENAVFTVTMNPPPTMAASVNYATADGTAVAGTDYTATSGTLNFAAGSGSATVSVPVLGTTADASGLAFDLVLSNPVNATIGNGTGVCTITHDAVASVSLSPPAPSSPAGQAELLTAAYSSLGGASNITAAQICAGPTGSPAASLNATYDAVTNLLYLTNPSNVLIGGFAPGSANVITTTAGSLNCANTLVTAGGNQLTVAWSLTPTSTLLGAQPVSLQVADNLGAASTWTQLGTWTVTEPSVSIVNTTVVVGASGTQNAVFTVTIGPAPLVAGSLNYATADGTAVAGTDYTATTGTLSVPAGATTATISVPVLGTTADASGAVFSLNLSSPVNLALTNTTATCTITHDAVAAVSLSPTSTVSTVEYGEQLTATYSSLAGSGNITSAEICVGSTATPSTSLIASYNATTNLLYLESGGTFIGGYAPGSYNFISTSTAYLNCSSTTVTKSGNQLQVNWGLTPTSGPIGEQPVSLDLTDSLGVTSGWQQLGTWTINPPALSISNTTVTVGPGQGENAVFSVTMLDSTSTAVTVNFATADGTATAGTDYTAVSGTLTIPAGSYASTISVPVLGTTADASGLTFSVVLSNPVNAMIGAGTGTCTITHDAVTAVSVAPSSLTSGVTQPESLTATYSSLDGAANITSAQISVGNPASTATSLIATYNGSANLLYLANSSGTLIGGYAPGSGNVISTASGSLNCAQTSVSRSGNQMTIAWNFTPLTPLIGNQPVSLNVSDVFGLSSGWQQLGTWNITPPALSIGNTAVTVGPTGSQNAKFTVTISPAPALAATVKYATADATAIAGTDYTATSGTLNFAAGTSSATFTVPALGRSIASTLQFDVLLSSPVNAVIATGTGVCTISHNPIGVTDLLGSIVFSSTRAGNNHIFSMNPDGSGVLQLTNTSGVDEGVPGVSPDGSKIAYQRQNDVWYMNSDGSGQTDIVIGGGPQSPGFEPGTNLISFSNPSYPDYDIFTIPITGGSEQQLIANRFGSYYGHWSPDGTKITYYTFDNPNNPLPDIYVANANGTNQTRLTTSLADTGPVFSPDGGQIAFASSRDQGHDEIYVMNADGTNQHRLTFDGATDDEPTFSPDGQKIAYASTKLGNAAIFVMNTDGTDQTNITDPAVWSDCPNWSYLIPAGAPSASIGNVSVTASPSGITNAVLTVTLSAASASTVDVGFRSYDGSAIGNTNYTPVNGVLTFAPGVTSQTISVPVGSEPLYGPTLNFSVRISGVGVTIGTQVGVATILNPNSPPAFNVTGGTIPIGATGTTPFTFPVTLSAPSSVASTVSYTTANLTATAGTDYTATSGTLTIPAGATTSSVNVPILGTTADASGLAFNLVLSNPVNATVGTGTATCVITHESAPLPLSLTPLPETTEVSTPATLTSTVSDNSGVSYIAQVNLSVGAIASPATSLTASYSAASNLLYLSNASGTLTGGFAPGSANVISSPLGSLDCSKTTITATGSDLVINWSLTPAPGLIGAEPTYLSATDTFNNVSPTDAFGTWTILPGASIGNTSVVVGPSGTVNAVFPVTLNVASPAKVTLTYATSNGTASAGTDYVSTSGTLNIAAGATAGSITVPVKGTTADASGLTFNVALSAPSNAMLATGTGVCTITHDFDSAVSVTPSPLTSLAGSPALLTTTYSSAEGAANITSAALCAGKLSSASASLYAKYVPSSNLLYLANASGTYIGGYTPGSANVITTGLGTLNCASTTVSSNGNNLVIGWSITPTSSMLGAQNDYLIVSDNFGVSSGWQNLGAWNIITSVSASIGNTSVLTLPSGTQTAVFAVTVSAPPAIPVTVNYATSNGTAKAGTDYTAASGTLTIPAGSTTGTISVPVQGGVNDASGLTFVVTLSNPVNATLGTATGTCTITHDVAPTLTGVSPTPATSQAGTAFTLTATYASVAGPAKLSSASLCVGKLNAASTSLYAKYSPQTNLLYLCNAAGAYIGGFAPGSANVISTPLGTLNCAQTTVSTNSTQLIIGWNITPTSSLLGTQSDYLIASDVYGLSSGWAQLGTWTITSPPPTAVSISPTTLNSPSGQGEVLTTTTSSLGGNGVLTSVAFCAGHLSSAANSWYLKYSPATNLLYAANASGTYIGGFTPGSANLITTPLGTLDCSQTTVTKSGNQIVIAWYLTPTSSLIGSQSDYLIASDTHGQSSGWQNLGAWTITSGGTSALGSGATLPSGSHPSNGSS